MIKFRKYFLKTIVILGLMTSLPLFLFFTISCGVKGDGLFYGTLGLGEGRIFIVNYVATPLQSVVTMYDLNGNFKGIAADTTKNGTITRGVTFGGSDSIVAATNVSATVALDLKYIDFTSGLLSTFIQNSNIIGALYDVLKHSSGSYFVVEGNTVERFDNGTRNPITGNPYINTPLGLCVINGGRGMTETTLGYIAVVSLTGDDINLYDVTSPTTSACVTAYTGFAGTENPLDVLGHSDGNIYVSGSGNSTLYRFDGNLGGVTALLTSAAIAVPTALAELPNGDILVASDTNDAVVRVSTSGTIVNANFIKNAFTTSMTDILVVPPQ